VVLWSAGCGDNAAPSRTYGGFSMSIQSWTFRAFDFEQALSFVDELGLAHVEMYDAHVPVAGAAQELAARRSRLDELGIRLLTHGTNPLSADHAANRALFEFARAMGIRNLLADPPAEALDSVEQLVDEFDIRIAIHNHGPGSRYGVPDDVLAALAGRDARIGTCVDTGHYIRSGVDPTQALRAFPGRLFGVHLKDVAAAEPTAPDVILGDGVLDVIGIFRALREVGLPADAALSLEYEANPDAPLADVRAGLAVADAAARAAVP
jgi:sugar phosphate isomerase/epimerase